MGKFYSSYAEALEQETECSFALDFLFEFPSLTIPPDLPIPDFLFSMPKVPFWCAID